MTLVDPAHLQADHAVRCEWGPTGASQLARGVDVAVVVDVLSFTTSVTVAVDRGITVFPFRWGDQRAAEYADEVDANLALQRQDARLRSGAVSLSPVSLQQSRGIERLVLPSPNGSTICTALDEAGVTVVAACLRNAASVGDWLAPQVADGARVLVVPAGERWPDRSLRPAAEDVWGAGAVLAGLDDALLSPEARLARAAYETFAERPLEYLFSCASGLELRVEGVRRRRGCRRSARLERDGAGADRRGVRQCSLTQCGHESTLDREQAREQAEEHLRRLVGSDDARLRDDQWSAIEALVIDQRRSLVVQRTGWGKSAVYFVATLLLRAQGNGPTVIISPAARADAQPDRRRRARRDPRGHHQLHQHRAVGADPGTDRGR